MHDFEAQFKQRTSAAHNSPLLNSDSSLSIPTSSWTTSCRWYASLDFMAWIPICYRDGAHPVFGAMIAIPVTSIGIPGCLRMLHDYP